ncbi:MAG: hypothetical protein IT350_07990 [Deltaproteobacteria bacterium]|nr:hypothetical protein [Deltaproteobacteria bacterium]
MTTQLQRFVFVILLVLLNFVVAGCGCGDDDDDDSPEADSDDDTDDDADDDTGDDDTGDDDTWPPLPDDDADDDADDDTGDDDTTPVCDWSTYDPLVEDGIDALGIRDVDAAMDAFEDAIDVCPEFGDAKLGLLLAGVQDLFAELPVVLAMAGGFPDIDWTALQQTIRDQLLPMNADLISLAAEIVAQHEDVRLFVSPMPLWVDGETVVIDAGGEWDIADVHNLSAIVNAADAVEHFLVSIDLEADWEALTVWPGGYDPVEIAHYFAGILLDMLADPNYPDFLKFVSGGEQDFEGGAVSLGFACLDVTAGFAAVRAETDPQEDDVTAYVDENENGAWDEGEPYRLPYMGVFAPHQNNVLVDALILTQDLGPALLDSGPEDLHPLLPDWLPLDDLNFVLELIASYVPGLTLPAIPVPVGYWFYNPSPDGLKPVAQLLVQALYDLTLP